MPGAAHRRSRKHHPPTSEAITPRQAARAPHLRAGAVSVSEVRGGYLPAGVDAAQQVAGGVVGVCLDGPAPVGGQGGGKARGVTGWEGGFRQGVSRRGSYQAVKAPPQLPSPCWSTSTKDTVKQPSKQLRARPPGGRRAPQGRAFGQQHVRAAGLERLEGRRQAVAEPDKRGQAVYVAGHVGAVLVAAVHVGAHDLGGKGRAERGGGWVVMSLKRTPQQQPSTGLQPPVRSQTLTPATPAQLPYPLARRACPHTKPARRLRTERPAHVKHHEVAQARQGHGYWPLQPEVAPEADSQQACAIAVRGGGGWIKGQAREGGGGGLVKRAMIKGVQGRADMDEGRSCAQAGRRRQHADRCAGVAASGTAGGPHPCQAHPMVAGSVPVNSLNPR